MEYLNRKFVAMKRNALLDYRQRRSFHSTVIVVVVPYLLLLLLGNGPAALWLATE